MPVATGAVKHRDCTGDGTPRGTAPHGHLVQLHAPASENPALAAATDSDVPLFFTIVPMHFAFITVFESEFLTQT